MSSNKSNNLRHTPRRFVPLFRSLFEPRTNAVAVLYPAFPYMGPIWIATSKVFPTKGMARYFHCETTYTSSICMLFQCKHCTAGVQCNHIHVKRSFLARIRNAIMSNQNDCCCGEHGHEPTHQFRLRHRLNRIRAVDLCGMVDCHTPVWISVPISVRWIALTCFWEEILETVSSLFDDPFEFYPIVHLHNICEVHQSEGGCPMGYHCPRIHVCRALWPSLKSKFRLSDPDHSCALNTNADETTLVTPWTMIGSFTNLLSGVMDPYGYPWDSTNPARKAGR
jgi:hypothetical protein